MYYFWKMKAVISGATRGIGRAIAQKLAEEEIDLVLLARSSDVLQQCKTELTEFNISVEGLAIDLAEKNALEMLQANTSIFEGTTLLVNNLGVYSMQNAAELDLKVLQEQINVNLFSAITLTQFVLKQSTNLKNIVNIASVMSTKAQPFAADYSISKHAFKAWNDALREELRTGSIKVSAIYPGSVNTSSWDGLDADRSKMIQAEDIAEMVSCVLKMKSNTLVEEIHVSPVNFTP